MANTALVRFDTERLSTKVTQTGHTFVAGNVVRYNTTSEEWELALADNENTLGQAVVVKVSGDIFEAAFAGKYTFSSSHGLTLGSQYYLSDSSLGELTTTAPTIVQKVLIPITVTEVLVKLEGLSGSGGGTVISNETLQVSKPLHGFNVLDAVRNDGATWVKAQANNAATLADGLVISAPTTGSFVVARSGFFNFPSHGLTPIGDWFFLSANSEGELTHSPPSQYVQPLVKVLDANTIFVNPSTGNLASSNSSANIGNLVITGSGAPSSVLGNNGDVYINTSNYSIYGPKLAGSWGSPTSLIGPQGSTGAKGDTGEGVPSGGSTGQILAKIDGTNYNTQWIDKIADKLTYNGTASTAEAEQLGTISSDPGFGNATNPATDPVFVPVTKGISSGQIGSIPAKQTLDVCSESSVVTRSVSIINSSDANQAVNYRLVADTSGETTFDPAKIVINPTSGKITFSEGTGGGGGGGIAGINVTDFSDSPPTTYTDRTAINFDGFYVTSTGPSNVLVSQPFYYEVVKVFTGGPFIPNGDQYTIGLIFASDTLTSNDWFPLSITIDRGSWDEASGARIFAVPSFFVSDVNTWRASVSFRNDDTSRYLPSYVYVYVTMINKQFTNFSTIYNHRNPAP